jgi:S-(hydroxymethyl)glutathione dehydrogenase / alcohol dehydrogenase
MKAAVLRDHSGKFEIDDVDLAAPIEREDVKASGLCHSEVMSDMTVGQRKIQGVMMGSTNLKHDIPMYAELYLQGRLDLDDLIAQEINIEQINDASQDLREGSIARSVVTSF